MGKPFMPIVGGALLAGTLALVGCESVELTRVLATTVGYVSVELTRAQLASSDPREVHAANQIVRQIVVQGHYGFQDFQTSERLEYVKLISDNEILFDIIGSVDDKEIVKTAAERIDFSKSGASLNALRYLEKINHSFEAIQGSGKSGAAVFSNKVLSGLSKEELETAWNEAGRIRNEEMKKRIGRRMIIVLDTDNRCMVQYAP